MFPASAVLDRWTHCVVIRPDDGIRPNGQRLVAAKRDDVNGATLPAATTRRDESKKENCAFFLFCAFGAECG